MGENFQSLSRALTFIQGLSLPFGKIVFFHQLVSLSFELVAFLSELLCSAITLVTGLLYKKNVHDLFVILICFSSNLNLQKKYQHYKSNITNFALPWNCIFCKYKGCNSKKKSVKLIEML